MLRMDRAELRHQWETYVRTGDAGPLLLFVASHPDVTVPCQHEYPYLHRIADISTAGQIYRLTRCVRCDEELTLQPIPAFGASPSEGGVPYWLHGETLREWADRENEHPSKEAVDWEAFRAT